MIRTIKQRIYVVGLLPLAILAMAAVVVNGVLRIQETNATLLNAKRVTAALLHAPAVDAIVVGNISNFEKAAHDVLQASPWLACVTLRDGVSAVVAQAGECAEAEQRGSYSPVVISRDEFSDFPQSSKASQIGSLGIVVQKDTAVRERRQVVVQLASSLVLIVAVVWLIGRILRNRLIEPLRRIGLALIALSRRDYSVRVPAAGHDELTSLAEAVNHTVRTTEEYTRELELRRDDADRALHDADEATLLRDGLIRSLTEDFEGPINQMHEELTAIAIANQDPALRDRIKNVIGMLQDAQINFSDLVAVVASAQGLRRSAARQISTLLDDIRGEFDRLSQVDGKPIHFNVTAPGEPTGSMSGELMLDIDGVRLKKALVLIVSAMAKHCRDSGVYANIDLIKLTDNQFHFAVCLKVFLGQQLASVGGAMTHGDASSSERSSMKLLGLSDREARIVDYLLRAVGMARATSMQPGGAISVFLTMSCNWMQPSSTAKSVSVGDRQLSVTLVSDDPALLRLTQRADISNHNVKVVGYSDAIDALPEVVKEDAVFLDISEDIADALEVLSAMQVDKAVPPSLIAICPQGRINESLTERLLELGFNGVIQKPLYYSRLMQAIGTSMATSRVSRGRDAHG